MGPRTWLFILLLFALFFGCEKQNNSPVLIITPNEIYLVSQPEDILTFNIHYEGEVEASRLKITSKTENKFTRTELDSVVSGKSVILKYEYAVPLLYEEASIYMEFILETADGGILASGRIIEVRISEKKLEETSGHEMYSKASEKQNAYNLILGQPLYSHIADSNLMHIMDTTDSDVMLRRWLSPAASLFVRYNGFDYANASNRTVKEAFNSGIKHEFVDDLERDDIIIARLYNNSADTSFCVIKITDIMDLSGSESDKYVFNIKR